MGRSYPVVNRPCHQKSLEDRSSGPSLSTLQFDLSGPGCRKKQTSTLTIGAGRGDQSCLDGALVASNSRRECAEKQTELGFTLLSASGAKKRSYKANKAGINR